MIELFLKHWIKIAIAAGALVVLAVAFFQSRAPAKLARQGDSLRIEYHGDTAAYAIDTLRADSVLNPLTPEVKTAVHRERKSAGKALKTGEARVANLTEQLHVAQPSAWGYVRPAYTVGAGALLQAGLGIHALGGRLEVGPEIRQRQRTRVVVSYQRDFRLF